MPPASLDLSPGSIIHIAEFKGTGFAPKHKFIIVLGRHNTNTILAFLLTSQRGYLNTYRARELVHIPHGTTNTLPRECWVQCFSEVLRLDVAELTAGFTKNSVHWKCNLKEFLQKVKTVVEESDVLSPQDIADILKII